MSGLPDDLEVLGAELEAAAARAVRRRERRRSFLTGAAAVVVAVPLAVAVSPSDLAPDTLPSRAAAAPSVTSVPAHTVRLFHHEAPMPAQSPRCADPGSCGMPSPPAHFAPAGRI